VHKPNHPIWEVLRGQGRKLPWLARRTRYSYGYVRLIACGAADPSKEFRQACASALDMPESLLFVAENFDSRTAPSSAAEVA
jgi:transcriptional regulator with XRE-family HTH domain